MLAAAALSFGLGLASGCSRGQSGGRAGGDGSVEETDGPPTDRPQAPDGAGPSEPDVPSAEDSVRASDSGTGDGNAAVGTDSGAREIGAEVSPDASNLDLSGSTSDACVVPPMDAGARDGVRRFLDLVVVGHGFEEHEGRRVHVFTRDPHSSTPLGYASDLVRAGGFTVRFSDGYARFSYS